MDISSELNSNGWYLSNEGLKICKEGLTHLDIKGIIQKALNIDLREIGEKFFPDELNRGKTDNLMGGGVVQIQKIKNASAPKYEYGSGAPPILRLLLTDGNTYVNCLQWGQWKSVSMDTPPGTKILLKPVKIAMQNNFLLLNESQFTVLGGSVAPLIEKWELNRRLASHVRTKGVLDGSGPPPWIPFGKPIHDSKQPLKGKNFRALETENKETKEEDEAFKQQRLAKVEEIAKAKEGKPKIFGGGKEMKQANFKNETGNTPPNDTFSNYGKPNRSMNDSDCWQSQRHQNDYKTTKNNKNWSNQDSQRTQVSSGSYTHEQSYSKDKRLDQKNKFNSHDFQDSRNQNSYQQKPFNNNAFHRNNAASSTNDSSNSFNQNKSSHSFRGDNASNSYRGNDTYNSYLRNDSAPSYQGSNSGNSSQREETFNSFHDSSTSSKKNPKNMNKNFKTYSDKHYEHNKSSDIESATLKMSQVKLHGYDNQTNDYIRVPNKPFLKLHAEVLAKYWEDNQFYRAEVTAIGENGETCVVRFLDYNNFEEILVNDVQPIRSGWDAGPISFQPSHWNNSERSSESKYSAISQDNYHWSSAQGHERQKPHRQGYRPSSKLYQSQQRHT